jgi:hypothetical protein
MTDTICLFRTYQSFETPSAWLCGEKEMLGIRIHIVELECISALHVGGDDVCLALAGTAGGGSRIVRVFPEESARSNYSWRMVPNQRVSPALTIFERPVPESATAMLRLVLIARNGGTYADAMICAAQMADVIVDAVDRDGEQALASMMFFETHGHAMQAMRSGSPIDFTRSPRDFAPMQSLAGSCGTALGSFIIQFTSLGNDWDDSLFPQPDRIFSHSAKLGRAVNLTMNSPRKSRSTRW